MPFGYIYIYTIDLR